MYTKLEGDFFSPLKPMLAAGYKDQKEREYGKKGWVKKNQGFPPQNIPRIEIFSGGYSYTAVKSTVQGKWPAGFWTCRRLAGHLP